MCRTRLLRILEGPAVAVIADAHFHDIEGEYDFAGIMVGGRKLTVRNAPQAQPAGALAPCLFTGEPSVEAILIARSY